MIETDSSASILHLQAKNKKDNQSKQKIEDFFRNGQPASTGKKQEKATTFNRLQPFFMIRFANNYLANLLSEPNTLIILCLYSFSILSRAGPRYLRGSNSAGFSANV